MKILGTLLYSSLGLVFYHIIVFPTILFLTSLFGKKKTVKYTDGYEPTVALLVAARNEEKIIATKIENAISLDYPKDKFRIVIVANGCTDKTVEIAKKYESQGVEVFEYGEIGKDASQNKAVEKIDSEILIFSDANVQYNKEAIREIVKQFSDETVGAVSGKHVYVDQDIAAGKMEGSYWDLVENRLRKAESDSGGCIGGAGSIYAIRSSIFEPPQPGGTSDLTGPLLAAIKGFRTVYAPGAIAFEESEKSLSAEYKRKIRVIHTSVAAIMLQYPWMLNPFKTGRIALLLWNHKVLRWSLPFLIIIAVLSATLRLAMKKGNVIDIIVFIGTTLFAALAMLGRGLGAEKPIPVLTSCYYIFMTLRAVVEGVMKVLTTGTVHVWGHER